MCLHTETQERKTPYGISQESETAIRRTKDNLDEDSKARFGQHQNGTVSLKRSTCIEWFV